MRNNENNKKEKRGKEAVASWQMPQNFELSKKLSENLLVQNFLTTKAKFGAKNSYFGEI